MTRCAYLKLKLDFLFNYKVNTHITTFRIGYKERHRKLLRFQYTSYFYLKSKHVCSRIV